MKIKNKKTSEIGYLKEIDLNVGVLRVVNADNDTIAESKSLAELNADWEDAPEEPKEDGLDNIIALVEAYSNNDSERYPKEIVEKLKAWKRLKDYNVKFNLDYVRNRIDFTYSVNNPLLGVLDGEEQIFNNMKIVFGGEE